MSDEILNAAPMVRDQGTNDLSTRTPPSAPLLLPQHLPKFYIFSAEGPGGPTYVDLDEVSITSLYGNEAFNVNSEYFKHQTPYLQAAVGAANNCVVHRLIPSSGKGLARAVLYLDYVAEENIIQYERDATGKFILDENGDKTPIMINDQPVTYEGHKVGWVVKTFAPGANALNPGSDSSEYDDIGLGVLPAEVGLMENSNGDKSQMVPIFECRAATPGEAGNMLIMNLFASSKLDLQAFPVELLRDGKQYPINFGMKKLMDVETGVTNTLVTVMGEKSVRGGYMPNGINPVNGATSYIGDIIEDNFIDIPIANRINLGNFFIYHTNLRDVLSALKIAECNYTTNENLTTDILDEIEDTELNSGDIYSFNIIDFKYSSGAPYFTVEEVDDTDKYLRLNKNSPVTFSGGVSGDLSLANFEAMVAADLANYSNSVHEYKDLVAHPESILYDSGFSMNTKLEFSNFISIRKDTFIVLSNFIHGVYGPEGSLVETLATGEALRTMVDLHPESATFGTPVMRAMIIGGSCNILNNVYKDRVPLTYEILVKSARYMGSKNGSWRTGYLFDRAPLSVISNVNNIDITWVPAGEARTNFWKTGVNFALNYELRRQFFPALKTVYADDTSVLNSYFTAVAISYLNKVAHAAWREFSGSISLTNAQLEERVNEFVAASVKDRFDGLYVIIPRCQVTAMDATRGYSWTLPIDIYANNMKTVMTTNVNAYRREDLE